MDTDPYQNGGRTWDDEPPVDSRVGEQPEEQPVRDRSMSATEFLDKTELFQLTGFARAPAQAAWLAAEGIPHKVDGKRVIVCRIHARAWVEGKPLTVSSGEFNWSSVK